MAWVLPKDHGGFVNAKVVTQTMNSYMASTDQRIGRQHVPWEYKNTRGHMVRPDEEQRRVKPKLSVAGLVKLLFFQVSFYTISFSLQLFADHAQEIWDKMVDFQRRKERVYNMTHDGKRLK